MNYADNPYEAPSFTFAAEAAESDRASFITKTYLHLAGAVAAFVALEAAILASLTPAMEEKILASLMASRFGWLVVLGVFMLVSFVANRWASSNTSVGMQYMGLGLYVVAQALIFLPLMILAAWQKPEAIPQAGLATLVLFAGLTAIVFLTRKDFSFLRGVLMMGGMAAFAVIAGAVVFGFSLGLFFIVAMIALMCGYILYDTSNVLHHYRIGQHVAASLALFSSLATLFWYVLQLFMSRD